MKLRILILAAWCSVTSAIFAAVPPPEKLLPADTLFMWTAPDVTAAKAAFREFPMAQLWREPEMKAFRDKFEAKFKKEVIDGIEKQLGIKVGDYAALAHGQLTFAIVQNGWEGQSGKTPAWLFLVDSRDKSEDLKTKLVDLKKRWIDSGKKTKTEKIRDVEFITLIASGAEMQKALDAIVPGTPGEEPAEEKKDLPNFEITIGQSGSLLIAGDSPEVIEKVLIRLSGGSVPALGEQARYESNHNAMFRDAMVYLWIDLKGLIQIASKAIAAAGDEAAANPLGISPGKVMGVLGLDSLTTVAIKTAHTSEGLQVDAFMGAPQSQRRGLIRLLAFETKESGPPVFVPADVTKFSRWRLDGKKLWSTLEAMVNEISPALSGMVQMFVESAGKDKDPNFNLKTHLIGNLGDDMIGFEKAPKSSEVSDLISPPSLFLLGSPEPARLIEAVKTAMSGLNPEGFKEREFLGRRIFSASRGLSTSPDGSKVIQQSIHFAATVGYVAISEDAAMLEEYLRSGEAQNKPLRDASGINDAAQRVGGMSAGVFGYEKQNETLKAVLTALKKNPDLITEILTAQIPGSVSGAPTKPEDRWLDFSLLPPFERIEKYFHFSVYSLGANPDGLTLKAFSPTPPALRK